MGVDFYMFTSWRISRKMKLDPQRITYIFFYLAKFQNARSLLCISLNNKSAYCVIPSSWKCSDKRKWGGQVVWNCFYSTPKESFKFHNLPLKNSIGPQPGKGRGGGYGYYLSNRPHFLWVYRRDNPRGMLGEHSKSL